MVEIKNCNKQTKKVIKKRKKTLLTFEIYSEQPICELPLLEPTLWTFTKDLHISTPALPRSPRYLNLTLSCCCHCIPQKTSWKLIFGNRLANTLSCLLQATKALLGRPALSPEPSRPPLCSRTQRGRKSRSVFASHVGTQALYTLQWHSRYFVSLTNRGEACKGCKKKFW